MSNDSSTKPPLGHVRVHINQKTYHSPAETTGEAIYRLGSIDESHSLYLEVLGDTDDPVIPRDLAPINLAEDAHLHSGPKETEIFVNTKQKFVSGRRVSFDEIVALSPYPVKPPPEVMYTIIYTKGPRHHPQGSLLENHTVKMKEEMSFVVSKANRS
jgi:hypothetical protein